VAVERQILKQVLQLLNCWWQVDHEMSDEGYPAAGQNGTMQRAMALVQLVFTIGFLSLNVVAIYKIIIKAGYSGNWILLVFAPFIAVVIGFAFFVSDVRSRSFHAGNFTYWFALGGLLMFIDYIFFLVFAFSEWPALRQRRQSYQSRYGYGAPGFAPPFGTGPGVRPPGAGSSLAQGRPPAWPAEQGDRRPTPRGSRFDPGNREGRHPPTRSRFQSPPDADEPEGSG
jgi:hypothetical protein